MEKAHTLRILNALAQGVDPGTGEQFPPGSAYQHPDTVRALFLAIQSMEDAPATNTCATVSSPFPGTRTAAAPEAAKPAGHGQSGSRWDAAEEERLAAAFDDGRTIEELARAHSRSRAAIEARLLKLGKIDASALTTQLRYPPKAASEARQETATYQSG
jgi:hypothetical protein